ncbi:hypothetical protein DSN97_07160 [Deferribacteraceae bacterium V6Fe1]|nr:hypothetical protein DSN97_07160 [Deferribacteraceae bacterium V6Fe1]
MSISNDKNKNYFKIIGISLVVVILWILLASVDAGPAGIGILVSVLAFIDAISGKFNGNEKVVWVIILLFSVIIGIVCITIKEIFPINSKIELLFGLISIIFGISYFLIGKNKKLK